MAPRDYYADLELPRTADIQDIKKQFRKLALKYHPDRNPGREQEVNSQFQIIQAANEVLSDPQQKAKYDATLGRSTASRFTAASGTASGVRGNPWQNVGQQFPTPPRRNPQPTSQPTSGAKRWQDRFSSGVPPTAKQKANPEPSTKASAAHAFESMRGGGYQHSAFHSGARQERPVPPPPSPSRSRPPPPPPPPPRNPSPPRTDAARKRADASFGTRKTGYYPHSGAGDEPPVTNNNYSTRINTERPVPIPDPLSQFREKDEADDEGDEEEEEAEEEDIPDTRKRTPYTSTGGERTNPFDGIPLYRAESAREPPRRASESQGTQSSRQKHRSSSVPKSEAKDKSQSNAEAPRQEPDQTIPEFRIHSDRQHSNRRRRRRLLLLLLLLRSTSTSTSTSTSSHNHNHNNHKSQPSQAKHFRGNQSMGLTAPQLKQTSRHSNGSSGTFSNASYKLTEIARINFNNVSEDGGAPEDSPPASEPMFFNRSSVEDINTNFAPDDGTTAWQFSAGSAETDQSGLGSRAGSRAGRRSPNKRPPLRKVDAPNNPPPPPGPQSSTGFDADDWTDKFGPQIFVPQSGTNGSTSPTRPSNRASSRKARPVRASVGNASMMEEGGGFSDSDPLDWPGRKPQLRATRPDSPLAMDIDPPQGAAEESPSESGPTTARNIPVEPSRPEWRSGDVGSITPEAEHSEQEKEKAKKAHPIPVPDNTLGSEDAEGFKANLADLASVHPFAYEPAGLNSLAELKDQLPFESKASAEIPVKMPRAEPLQVPEPPPAPRLPSVVTVSGIQPDFAVWRKYHEEFQIYLKKWDRFNASVVEHFVTRRTHIDQMRTESGHNFHGARGDGDVTKYHNWIEQDLDVRKRWQAACEEHDLRFREFVAFREKMK
ncbi:Meiotically up-regulated protein [Escovopsis weberi]|uniref:Meiotically up-regulated protein n=1 Tax=Escovopsis weberi TaxID=150374 RepID=A0A0M8MWG7_ESCWE|nr:Meiotically up-regulated protein [Escovopsis weberi]